jgi:hypothetical protein
VRAPDLPGALVERASGFLASRMSRRSVITRSAFVGSALASSGLDFALRPGSAYSHICTCGNPDCGCGTTCCAGFSEFCCTLNGGYNYCPAGTIMGGWWLAQGSIYCNGPRYYMDCNAMCQCQSGCGGGYGFCDPGCDGLTCGCALGDCNQYLTGCFQFRYGQCNQDVPCIGRIQCRVVACIPPWEVDPTCTTTVAEDDSTANMNAPCNTAVPEPPPPPPPPCDSPATQCQTVGVASIGQDAGYYLATAFGKVLAYGGAAQVGDVSGLTLSAPIVGLAAVPGHWSVVPPGGSPPPAAGYWLAAADGGVFCFGAAGYHGSMGGQPLNRPIVGMAATVTSQGYWLVASDGGVFCFGDAGYHGSTGGMALNRPIVGMAPTPTGAGYWLVASDGGIFTFGDAGFHGSMGGQVLNAPVVGMAPTPTGRGYWLVASDGGVFTFGDAAFDGSAGGEALARPVVGMAPAGPGAGYWLVAEDGGIFSYDAAFYGSPA